MLSGGVGWWQTTCRSRLPRYKRVHKLGGKRVNEWRACPFSDDGNTLQKIASSVVYKLTWVMYTSRCSFGSLVPSYFLMVKIFSLKEESLP